MMIIIFYCTFLIDHTPVSTKTDAETKPQLYALHEKEKKNHYMTQVLQLKGSFFPLVFTTTGGTAPEAKRFRRRIALLIATRTNEPMWNSAVMNIGY